MSKKLLSCILCLLMLFCGSVAVLAQEHTTTSPQEYKETYLYIDFSNIDIQKTQTGWNITPKNNLLRSTVITTESNINNLKSLIEEFPDVEKNLFEDISNANPLIGVSFTTVPLI